MEDTHVEALGGTASVDTADVEHPGVGMRAAKLEIDHPLACLWSCQRL